MTNPIEQSITTATLEALDFSALRTGSDPAMFNILAPTRLTAPSTGWYQVSGSVRWIANEIGFRTLAIRQNGLTNIVEETVAAITGEGVATTQSLSTLWYLLAGEYVELTVFQDSGVSLDIQSIPAASPEFGMVHVSS